MPSPLQSPEPVFLNVYGAQESIPGMNSASLCGLAGQYDNPIPTRFLAPIDYLKIPAPISKSELLRSPGIDSKGSIPCENQFRHGFDSRKGGHNRFIAILAPEKLKNSVSEVKSTRVSSRQPSWWRSVPGRRRGS